MRKSIYIFWLLLLSLLLAGCDTSFDSPSYINNEEEFDLTTQDGRQSYCLWWIKKKIKSGTYSILWDDSENEDYKSFTVSGLLEVDNWYYDVECVYEKDWKWFEVSLSPVEEVTF